MLPLAKNLLVGSPPPDCRCCGNHRSGFPLTARSAVPPVASPPDPAELVPMTPAWPRYLLFTETLERGPGSPGWRFMLHEVETDRTIVASDHEPGMNAERLGLMAVVRGLEALDGPSAVKLVTASSYVRRGVVRGLKDWRANDWKWEHFGRRVAVRDEDLWRRVDQAMKFHRVTCRGMRPESASNLLAAGQGMRPVRRVEAPLVRGINEPALLIVRGQRRHFVFAESSPNPATEKLAVAG